MPPIPSLPMNNGRLIPMDGTPVYLDAGFPVAVRSTARP